MKEGNFAPKLRILVAPMDWGLGHATRCIPLVHYLLQQGTEVWLAGEGRIEALLRNEFPDLPFVHLPGYNIEYGRSKWDLLGKMALQIPKILGRIEKENEWLQEAVAQHGFDVVISDNRFGLYHEDTYSVSSSSSTSAGYPTFRVYPRWPVVFPTLLKCPTCP
jgi:hypothetical protein